MMLKYQGDGKFIYGVPAHDLTSDDIAQLIEGNVFVNEDDAIVTLTSRGLYSVIKPRKPKEPEPIEKEDDEDIG